ncbi:MAG: methyltransferase domain-containing protein [Deltaproteobacteria bacterium]|nr:MAG: methyltransferase domain-containing protein [Deltaproteobacteria bacterium]
MNEQDKLKTEGITLGPLAKCYDLLNSTIGHRDRFFREIAELAGVKEGDRVLDVGCGTGILGIWEKEKAGDKGYVAGIDASRRMIDQARKNATKRGVEVDFKSGLIEDIPYDDNYFDVVTSSMMVHHLPLSLKKKGFQEIFRVLRPGGHLLLVDFGRPGSLFGKLFGYLLLSWIESTRANLKGMLPGLLEEAGFKEVKVLKKIPLREIISAQKPPA